MPEIKLSIGGRDFEVACQEGEENFLTDAANLLNSESQKLVSQLGRLSESRMLLMAGLMLADRMINAEKSFAERELLIKQRETELDIKFICECRKNTESTNKINCKERNWFQKIWDKISINTGFLSIK